MAEGLLIRRPSSRGRSDDSSPPASSHDRHNDTSTKTYLARRASDPSNFTLRAIVVGSLIGILVAFSNTYFGLQTGWISGMVMPSALIGFATFKAITPLLNASPLTPVENVLVQTVAQSVGTMPLGCGFVGLIPAIEFLLEPSELAIEKVTGTGVSKTGLDLSLPKLVVWALGVCFFGVVFGVPLRKQLIIREQLKFPSGTATALMIGVLHGTPDASRVDTRDGSLRRRLPDHTADRVRDSHDDGSEQEGLISTSHNCHVVDDEDDEDTKSRDWASKIKLMFAAFSGSAVYTIVTYFVPQLRDLPVFGTALANNWEWTLNLSPAYFGQGIIMGPSVVLHMLIGVVLGWGILSPLAKYRGWASGPVDDWETGSKGWILWVSLAIMLADAIVNLGWLFVRPLLSFARRYGPDLHRNISRGQWHNILSIASYSPLSRDADSLDGNQVDAPSTELISTRTTIMTLVMSVVICILAINYSFSGMVPVFYILLSLCLAAVLSILSCRSLGETDLNPASGISKLTQLFFAALTPSSSKHGLIVNLVAGGISEAGTLQAADLLQDLKTGHLLGASPRAQFYGQLIGSAIGAVVSAVVYRLYTNVYRVPGDLFRVPTGYVWIFTARLVTGRGLPPYAAVYAAWFGGVWALISVLRIWGARRKARWVPLVPGGIAVAVGMYNVPSFTLMRVPGGLLAWYWTSRLQKQNETPIVLLASGLILGEGLFSIANLGLASAGVPHL